MIRKRNPKNRWLATVLNVGIYDTVGAVEIDSLAINGFNGGIYPQDNYLTGQPYIFAQVATGGGTTDAVIVYWLDENQYKLKLQERIKLNMK